MPSYGAANNFFLNLINIYINNPHDGIPPLGPMVDVKNVINKKQLEELKVFPHSELEPSKYTQCLICLDEYEKDDKLRLLKCEHGFHTACIDKWLTDCNYKCPVCRDESNDHHAEV